MIYPDISGHHYCLAKSTPVAGNYLSVNWPLGAPSKSASSILHFENKPTSMFYVHLQQHGGAT